MQSTLFSSSDSGGVHVAIIMDGNGRWATARGLGRTAGHRAGGEAVRRTVKAAPELGITTLTLYAFSSDNWRRPPREVAALMHLFHQHLKTEVAQCASHGIRINVIGRRDRLDSSLRRAIERAEAATATGDTLHLRIAVDYSARDSILEAATRLRKRGETSRDAFSTCLGEGINDSGPSSDVDLLIRTGGEKRLSDFLLWECAYAELLFVEKMWPDFAEADLAAAISEFHSRQRRFGGLLRAAR